MKKSLTLLGIAALGLTTRAQIANFSAAPDFTGTDIDGNTWHLNELLDQGKTVIMDVSATWCSPCWSYHNSGALEDLYAAHGPNGDNTVMVLMIEGDGTTNNDDLHGLTSESQGDWTAGTLYPIIDDAGIADDYQITYFPTVFKICPNRVVTEVGQLETAELYAECQACLGLAETGTNVSLITYTGALTACQDGTLDIPVKIQNRGTDALTTCDLEVRENGTAIANTTWTGN
nr:TlpA family protein disulfide reductase [Flavobacteriales bacterium]